MNKTYTTILLTIITIAISVLTGCSDILGGDGYVDPTEDVAFSATLEDPDHAPMSRSVGDSMMMEMNDWVDSRDLELTSRAVPLTSLTGSAAIFGYAYDDAFSQDSRVITNAKYNFDGNNLEPEEPYAWVKLGNKDKAWFCSYAPYAESSGGSYNNMTPTVFNGLPGVTYTVPADAKNQTDFLYAKSSEIDLTKTENRTRIPFTYKHSLTAIQFRMGFACTVKSISIQHVKNSGTFTFKSDGEDGWETSTLDGDASYTFELNKSCTKDQMVIDGDNTLMLLPQDFGEESTYTADNMPKVVLEYSDTDGDHIVSASLAGTSWVKGKKIIYTLYNTEVKADYVYFDLAAASVKITATSYSGKVYVNGTATDVEASGLTAAQIANTKFYVYQSTGETDGNYDKDNTGYASTDDMAYPEKCRIPNYEEVTCNGKSWGKYITNNEDLRGIISNWTSGAATVGRTSTGNNIIIEGTTTYNVTLDNIWTKYYANKTSGYTITSQGLQNATEGDIIIKNNGSTGKFNLKLKGDNRLYRIFYDNNYTNKDQAYLRFTSIDGDGSSTGTLTAAPERAVDKLGEGVAIIGPSDNGDHSYGFIFDGGTIFASDPLTYSNSEANNGVEGVIPNANYHMCTIGGGGNGAASVYIHGGTLTALGHSTAPAIGGGGGHSSQGGAGTVEITGGRVYAYTYGVWTKVYSKFVPITTIGGGGSVQATGAAGTVKISGGYVYAQSRGGAALGGACSPSNPGGNGTVTITGGTVIAKSVGGECLQTDGKTKYTIVPGTAIGGGNGSTGGTATVTITGGTVRTGSVGGGKPVTTGNPIGNATIKIEGGTISGQFIMANAGSASPSFTMTGGIIKNSSTTDITYLKAINPSTNAVFEGGAVHMEQGTCNISGGTINGCSATTGGAVYMNGGTFNLSGGTISKNTSTSHGGAVYVSGGNVNVTGGSLTGNSTINGNGGAVYVTGGSFSMDGGSIISNAANSTNDNTTGNGGGVYVASTSNDVTAKILSGTVTNNTADHNGGAMCVDMSGSSHSADITIGKSGGSETTPNISSNSAALSGGALCVLGSNSNVTINSGTIKGNVSAYQKNEDIRNDGGMVTLNATTDNSDINYKTVTFHSNNGKSASAVQRIVTSTNSVLTPPDEVTVTVPYSDTSLPWNYQFYTFKEWNTRADGKGDSYANGATMNISADMNLYAIWQSSSSSSAKRRVNTKRR